MTKYLYAMAVNSLLNLLIHYTCSLSDGNVFKIVYYE